MNDPISDSVRAILDGHVVLSRDIANQGHYPAIDVLSSASRLLPDLLEGDELKLVHDTVAVLSTFQKSKDMIEIGAYRAGTSPTVDRAIQLMPDIDKFLRQTMKHAVNRGDAMKQLAAILSKKAIN